MNTIKMLTGEYLGRRLKVTLKDGGQYEGVLFVNDMNDQNLTLKDVFHGRSGKRVPGVLTFFQHEIKKVEILPEKEQRKYDDLDFHEPQWTQGGHESRASKRSMIAEFLTVNSRQEITKTKATPEEPTSPVGAESKRALQKDLEQIRGPKLTCHTNFREIRQKSSPFQTWPIDYILIKACDEVFREAMIDLQSQTILGVACEGKDLGRHGKLSYLQIATRNYVLVFDVLSLGRRLFSEGLRLILEHPSIQKVIHDSRRMSDLLFHQYGVLLINVFDTQVAQAMINRTRSSQAWRVANMATLLLEHVDLHSDHGYFFKEREEILQADPEVWMQRPPTGPALVGAVQHAMYLLALRVGLLEAMLEEFSDGVDIYLGVMRDAQEDRLKKLQANTKWLPEEFANISVAAQRLREKYENRYKERFILQANQKRKQQLLETCVPSDKGERWEEQSARRGSEDIHRSPVVPDGNSSSARKSPLHQHRDEGDRDPVSMKTQPHRRSHGSVTNSNHSGVITSQFHQDHGGIGRDSDIQSHFTASQRSFNDSHHSGSIASHHDQPYHRDHSIDDDSQYDLPNGLVTNSRHTSPATSQDDQDAETSFTYPNKPFTDSHQCVSTESLFSHHPNIHLTDPDTQLCPDYQSVSNSGKHSTRISPFSDTPHQSRSNPHGAVGAVGINNNSTLPAPKPYTSHGPNQRRYPLIMAGLGRGRPSS